MSGAIAVLLCWLAPAQPEQTFWRWFTANSAQVQRIRSGHEPIADELAAQLSKVHPDLTWEVGPPAEQRELVISAAGIKQAFPAVKALVAAKPSLPGWQVIAFRPRRDPSFSVTLGSYELKPENVWFRAELDGDKAGLTIFVPGYANGDDTAGQAVYLLLDNALGEYDVEMWVGFIEIAPAPRDPRAHGLRPFVELPHAVDRLLKRAN